MGATTSQSIQYAVLIGDKKPNETQILRHHSINNKPLRNINNFGCQTVWDALLYNINTRKRGTTNFLGTRSCLPNGKYADHYSWTTYQQAHDKAIAFAKAVTALELCPEFVTNDNVTMRFMGIYAKNREEWVIADLASHCNSITVVTLYDTLGLEAMQYIFEQTELTTVVIEEKGLQNILSLARDKRVGKLKNLILLDKDSKGVCGELQREGINVYMYEDILRKGNEVVDVQLHPAKPETICTICYTSGTTGKPKGAMVSHKALLSEVNIMEAVDLYIKDDDVYLSFLPLAHIMERLILALLISYGREIGFYSGSTMRLMEDAGILKPTLMASVPRVFQRVYEGINLKVDKLSPFERALFRKGVSQKLKDYATYGVLTNVFWDSLVFNKIRKLLGGRMRFMLTGAAPMSPEMLTFLKVVLCCQISEGYGQTEDCAGMLISNAYDRVAGHVGGPGFANEVKLVDVPELDYYTNSAEPKGEICIRGPVLFDGYLNDSERTKEVVDSEGWLHTGDVGVMLTHHGNAIRVIDRVKNIFKLQQGEYIAPEKLENVLIRSLWVSQLFVYGSSMENYLVAVVVPRTEKVVEYFNSKGETCSKDNVKEKYKDVALRKQIVTDLETLGRENDFKGFEVVKKVYLCPYQFTIENDLVGPTLKVKRHVAARHFKKEIEELYKENI